MATKLTLKKIALALEDKDAGSIFYHEFIDELSRHLRKHSRQRKRNSNAIMRKKIHASCPDLQPTIDRVVEAVRSIVQLMEEHLLHPKH